MLNAFVLKLISGWSPCCGYWESIVVGCVVEVYLKPLSGYCISPRNQNSNIRMWVCICGNSSICGSFILFIKLWRFLVVVLNFGSPRKCFFQIHVQLHKTGLTRLRELLDCVLSNWSVHLSLQDLCIVYRYLLSSLILSFYGPNIFGMFEGMWGQLKEHQVLQERSHMIIHGDDFYSPLQ